MEFTKNNKFGYAQVAISFVIILISIFLPYCSIVDYDYGTQLRENISFSIFLMDYTVSRVFVAVFILSLVVNIFVQSKKSFGWLSLGVATQGIIAIIICHSEYHSGYSVGFYLILISIIALFVVALVDAITGIVNAPRVAYNVTPQNAECEKVNTAHAVSNSEIEELKARSARLKAEREKVDAELENELRKEELNALRAKTEKLEKELMVKELEELKAKLAQYEKNETAASESSSEN